MSQLETLIADMTIADLAKLAGTSVTEIAVYALGGSASRPNGTAVHRRPGNGSTTRAAASPGKSEATDQLAQDILAALGRSDTPLRSMDLEKLVGGTTPTRRYVLHKLLADKKIRKSGTARGTRYALR
jgi:hypothetical protein